MMYVAAFTWAWRASTPFVDRAGITVACAALMRIGVAVVIMVTTGVLDVWLPRLVRGAPSVNSIVNEPN